MRMAMRMATGVWGNRHSTASVAPGIRSSRSAEISQSDSLMSPRRSSSRLRKPPRINMAMGALHAAMEETGPDRKLGRPPRA